MGKSVRRDLARRTKTPGPGDHNIDGTLNRSGVSIGRGKRPAITGNSVNPGPAEYTTSGRIDSGPKYSMGSKNNKTKIHDTPSAAEYDPDKSGVVMTAAPNYAIGTGKRGGARQPHQPGPDAYTPASLTYSMPKYSFG